MSFKYLVPAVLVSLLAGVASANAAPAADPVRARVAADLGQARQDGDNPPSEAGYVYPDWVKIANPAGVVMTDGHPEYDQARAATPAVASSIAAAAPAATPAVAQMTDGHAEFDAAARSGKGAAASN